MFEDETQLAAACFHPNTNNHNNNNMEPQSPINNTNNNCNATSPPPIQQNDGFSHENNTNNTNISTSAIIPPPPSSSSSSSSSIPLLDHHFQNPNHFNINNNNNNDNHSSYDNGSSSHSMMGLGYPQFDVDDNNIHTTTSDLLTLLHLPRSSFASSSSSFLPLPPPPPPFTSSSISFAKSSPFLDPGMGMGMGMGMMQDEDDNNNNNNEPPNMSNYDPTMAAATLPYDPLFHLNLPPHSSPLLRDLMFQSLPHPHGSSSYDNNNATSNGGMIPTTENNNNNGNGSSSSLFMQMEDGEGSNMNHHMNHMNMSGLLYQQDGGGGGDHEHVMMNNTNANGMFEFSRGSLDDHAAAAKLGNNNNKGLKNFVTERQRRENFNNKYTQLRHLIPNTTKQDRASTVLDAINYINELKRTVGELKLLVEKKRISKERIKRLKTEDDNNNNDNDNNNDNPCENAGGLLLNGQQAGVEGSGVVKPDPDEGFGATQLRSSWLQRKCKDTEVDVRIVDDEVTIKLVQRKKINCLLWVSRTLDELQLDLRHVAGGHVGDYYSYLFNSKICEGSTVYASAIANKVIEVVERQYAAASLAVNVNVNVNVAPTPTTF